MSHMKHRDFISGGKTTNVAAAAPFFRNEWVLRDAFAVVPFHWGIHFRMKIFFSLFSLFSVFQLNLYRIGWICETTFQRKKRKKFELLMRRIAIDCCFFKNSKFITMIFHHIRRRRRFVYTNELAELSREIHQSNFFFSCGGMRIEKDRKISSAVRLSQVHRFFFIYSNSLFEPSAVCAFLTRHNDDRRWSYSLIGRVPVLNFYFSLLERFEYLSIFFREKLFNFNIWPYFFGSKLIRRWTIRLCIEHTKNIDWPTAYKSHHRVASAPLP